jgi:hypothetical protein
MGSAPELPAPIEIKPPTVRRSPPAAAAPAPVQRSAPRPFEWFLQGNH